MGGGEDVLVDRPKPLSGSEDYEELTAASEVYGERLCTVGR